MNRFFPAGPTTAAFLEATRYMGELISSDRTGASWQEPSVLELMTVGDVAGHAFLVLRRVGKRAEGPIVAQGHPPASASLQNWTWIRIERHDDLDEPDHRQVRHDAAHVAAWGWEGVRDAFLTRTEQVAALLGRGCPSEVEVAGRTLTFGAYLATRIVELVVHADDLASSVGLVASPPEAAVAIAIQALVDAARSVHGDLPVLRGLTRNERIPGGISEF